MDELQQRPDPVPEIVDLLLQGLLEPVPWWSWNKKKVIEARTKFVQEISAAYKRKYTAVTENVDLEEMLQKITQVVLQLTVLASQLELAYRSKSNENFVH